MKYDFDVEVAKNVGVECAIMLSNIEWWCKTNEANGKNFHDGRHWTFNSVTAWHELFPFWSTDQIRRILDKLEKEKLIVSGCYNEQKYDRTKWYSGNRQIHLVKSPNGTGGNPEPIQDNKPKSVNTDIEDISLRSISSKEREKEFQKFIEDNPGNVTAKVASRFISLGWKPKESVESFREWLTALATLHKADPEEIDRCSQEWAVYWKGRDDKKIKNFKTCFGNCPALPNNRNKWKK